MIKSCMPVDVRINVLWYKKECSQVLNDFACGWKCDFSSHAKRAMVSDVACFHAESAQGTVSCSKSRLGRATRNIEFESMI